MPGDKVTGEIQASAGSVCRPPASWVMGLAGALTILCAVTTAGAKTLPDPEAFDGSFRLETGEILTGGYFVEDGEGRYLYMDTENPVNGGLFERVGETRMRSVSPDDRVRLTFAIDNGGVADTIVWQEEGSPPIRGRRVYPHRSRSVAFTSDDGTKLTGRLLVPECAGPHPLVVSVHGSGAVNRYGGSYHTYFLTQGMAVLAYDKRGYTNDASAWLEPDLSVLSADAVAAVAFAARQPGIDQSRIGLVGSSQAGWVIPRAAIEAPATTFMIVRAGAAASQLETVLHEIRQELRLDGLHGLELDYAMDLRREIYELAMNGAPLSATDTHVAPYLEKPWYKAAFGEGPVSSRWSPRWWAWASRNLGVSSGKYLSRFDGPVLWFLAELDENVPLVLTREVLRDSLARAPGDDHEIVVLENTRHSFLIASPDGTPRFSPGFFSRMGLWLRARGLSDSSCWSE